MRAESVTAPGIQLRAAYRRTMPRPLRFQDPGIYHLTAQGVRRSALFRDGADRGRWVEMLPRLCERYLWTCIAYCAMTTHYHLLVRTRLANLALGMQWLNGTWGSRFNRRHGEVGHVFRCRYASAFVESEEHLLETGRYIPLNPVRAGACLRPLDWPWSSYAASIGVEAHGRWLDATPILDPFGSDREARRRYRDFVEGAIAA
jgi:putative transposase